MPRTRLWARPSRAVQDPSPTPPCASTHSPPHPRAPRLSPLPHQAPPRVHAHASQPSPPAPVRPSSRAPPLPPFCAAAAAVLLAGRRGWRRLLARAPPRAHRARASRAPARAAGCTPRLARVAARARRAAARCRALCCMSRRRAAVVVLVLVPGARCLRRARSAAGSDDGAASLSSTFACVYALRQTRENFYLFSIGRDALCWRLYLSPLQVLYEMVYGKVEVVGLSILYHRG
ncbi:hypothetical protein EDB89DRAFT_1000084 [Lactarius sanguifluus]|nr:hypothetical protein EDB89DRAFT_1000084 [Lactarius sanguifluus]